MNCAPPPQCIVVNPRSPRPVPTTARFTSPSHMCMCVHTHALIKISFAITPTNVPHLFLRCRRTTTCVLFFLLLRTPVSHRQSSLYRRRYARIFRPAFLTARRTRMSLATNAYRRFFHPLTRTVLSNNNDNVLLLYVFLVRAYTHTHTYAHVY